MRTATAGSGTRLARLLSEEIRVTMVRKGMNQRDLAKKLEEDPSWVSRRLSGRIDMSMGDVDRFAEALNTDALTLLRSMRGLFGVKRRLPGGYSQVALMMPQAA